MHRLDIIADDVSNCKSCKLHTTRTKAVFERGNRRARLMLVGEAPGADEDRLGVPFIGKAGELLDNVLVAAGIDTTDVYIANVIKCRPPENRKPERDELEVCAEYIDAQIAEVQPQVIVALGATAAKELCGITSITKARGNWHYCGNFAVMPTLHPAYLLRVPTAKQVFLEDLRAAWARVPQGAR